MTRPLPPIRKWHVYVADLNPRHKAEPGKVRPVVVIQTDLLNNTHPTTLICPITTQVQTEAELLRVHMEKGEAGLKEISDILVDQIRAIDNSRITKRLGALREITAKRLKECVDLILD